MPSLFALKRPDDFLTGLDMVQHVRKMLYHQACFNAACELCSPSPSGGVCAATALVTAALGTASLSLCGLYCNHADLSPRYAPFLLGMTNTIGALPGIIGVAVTGAILDVTGGDFPAKTAVSG